MYKLIDKAVNMKPSCNLFVDVKYSGCILFFSAFFVTTSFFKRYWKLGNFSVFPILRIETKIETELARLIE